MQGVLKNRYRVLGLSILMFGMITVLMNNESTTQDLIIYGLATICLIFINIFHFRLFDKAKKNYFGKK